MRLHATIRALKFALFHRTEFEEQLDEELHVHIQNRADDLARSGLPREEAERRARIEFGGYQKCKEECREANGTHLVDTLLQDVRYGLRILGKNPGFTFVAILTLALGIGATTAIFSVIDAVLLRPLPYNDPDRVVMVYNTNPKHPALRLNPSPADCLDWKAENRVFSDLAIIDWDIDPVLSQAAQPVRIPGLRVSANYFSVFGVPPLLGRTFLPGEDQPGSDNVAVLSYGLWRQEFGSDRGIVGKTIRLDDESYKVIGVMPAQFGFINNISNTDWSKDVAIWMPNPFKVTPKTLRGYNWLAVIARLKRGVSLAQAQADMAAINEAIVKAYPETNEGLGVKVQPLQKDLVRDVRKPLALLLAAVTLTLLIACSNVANLLLARAVRRQKEIGIRLAVGASRARLIRQLLTESTLLSLAGGIAGVFLASLGSHTLVRLSPSTLPRAQNIGVDFRVLAFTLLVSLFTGVLFGAAPAIIGSNTDLNQSLKEAGRSSEESLWGRRFRGLLVVGEIALSLMLLVAAGLAMNSFFRLLRIDPGFDPQKVIAVQLDLVRPRYADISGSVTKGSFKGERLWTLRPSRWTFARDVLQRIRILPGVESAAATDPRPPEGGPSLGIDFTIEGQPKPRDHEGPSALYRPVTPDYFRTMRIPLLEGRLFTDADDQEHSQPVVIIDQAVARHYFPHGDAVGQHLRTDFGEDEAETAQIVGVVGAVRESGILGDVDWGLATEPEGVMYFPYFRQPRVHSNGIMFFVMKVSFVVRTSLSSTDLGPALRNAIRQVDKDQPIGQIQTMEQVLSDSIADRHFYMLLLGIFAGIALLLAAAGIYAAMSYFVSERTHEIGLRMALGAGRNDVLRLVVGQGLVLVLVGLALGIIGATVLTRYLASLLYGVSPVDPATFAAVCFGLSAVALLACYIPARRATRVDPMVALRCE